MKWLRMRPETLEDLDLVDWRGQWKRTGDEEDDFDADGEDDDEEGGHGRLENFDDDLPGEEGEEEEEEEEEDGAGAGGRGGGPSIPYPPAAPSGRLGGRGRAALAPIPDWTLAAPEANEDESVSSQSDASSLVTPDDRPVAEKRPFGGNSKQAPGMGKLVATRSISSLVHLTGESVVVV